MSCNSKSDQDGCGAENPRGTTRVQSGENQIFARNIVEQCIEWNAFFFVNFIDFRKAFDSIDRDSLWAVIRHYGVPQKIISLINMFYEPFECGVILRKGRYGLFRDAKRGETGMHALSSTFLILKDHVVRMANEGSQGGIQW